MRQQSPRPTERRETDARGADGAFIDRVAGPQHRCVRTCWVRRGEVVENGQCHAVFGTAAWIEEFELGVDSAFGEGGEMGEEDERGVADGGLEAFAGWSNRIVIGSWSASVLGEVGDQRAGFIVEEDAWEVGAEMVVLAFVEFVGYQR